jgi:osmoprotectant transport system permease protein
MSDTLTQSLELLPHYFAQHLLLTLASLGIGVPLGLGLALLAHRVRWLAGPLTGFAGVVQTVPSLALLALMVPLLRMIGFVPALIALVLYSLLPVVRNTITALRELDGAILESADGIGLTRRQRLTKVELPLVAPSIVAGIRTSAVLVVGIATLATPVGQASLGYFIFTGLQTGNQTAVIVGCLAAAVMALSLDGVIRLLERGVRDRSTPRVVLASLVLLGGCVAGLMPLMGSISRGSDRPIVVGAKTFTEQYILAELIGRRLEGRGVPVSVRSGMGSQLLFDAMASGAVDVYVDYTGTLWTNVLKRTDRADRATMVSVLVEQLQARYDITVAGGLGFENTYALAVARRRAEEDGLSTISDLAPIAPGLTLGGDVEFFGRPEWIAARDVYALAFGQLVPMDATLMYDAVSAGRLDAVAAFSTDGRIPAFDLTLLQDDQHVFPPYDAIILLSSRAASDERVLDALSPLLESIDAATMARANMRVDVEGGTPEKAAGMLDEQIRANAAMR